MVADVLQKNEDIILTEEDQEIFDNANKCYICDEEIKYKCRDHDHFTGKYRGAAHCKCNINFFSNRYLPVVFHNLRGYDGHQIIREAFNLYPDREFSIIPNSFEKFMSFKFGSLKFIDSFQFMASSLEKLVENLYDENDKYKNFNSMKQYYNNNNLNSNNIKI